MENKKLKTEPKCTFASLERGIVLSIIQNYHCFECCCKGCLDLTEWFGYFKNDGKRNIHQLFKCFIITDPSLLPLLPVVGLTHLEYWGEQISLRFPFLESLRRITLLEGFFLIGEKGLKLLSKNDKLQNLYFLSKIEGSLEYLNKMGNLKTLGLFRAYEEEPHRDLVLPNLRRLFLDHLPGSITFQHLRGVKDVSVSHSFISKKQIDGLLSLEHLEDILFCCCFKIHKSFVKLYSKPGILRLRIKDLYQGRVEDFEAVTFPPEQTTLKEIGFEGKGVPVTSMDMKTSKFWKEFRGCKTIETLSVINAGISFDFFDFFLENSNNIASQRLVIRVDDTVFDHFSLIIKAIELEEGKVRFLRFSEDGLKKCCQVGEDLHNERTDQ